MKLSEFQDLAPQFGFAGGGAVVAGYLFRMVVRIQRDFTNRYAVELEKVRRQRDDAEARANRYAVQLAQAGIYPSDGSTSGHSG